MAQFHSLKIKSILRQTEKAVSITFEVPENLKTEFNFKAGQYITLKTRDIFLTMLWLTIKTKLLKKIAQSYCKWFVKLIIILQIFQKIQKENWFDLAPRDFYLNSEKISSKEYITILEKYNLNQEQN